MKNQGLFLMSKEVFILENTDLFFFSFYDTLFYGQTSAKVTITEN